MPAPVLVLYLEVKYVYLYLYLEVKYVYLYLYCEATPVLALVLESRILVLVLVR